ncbi:MAG TPA: hypothetical protein VFU28_26160 [Vicinamibacterales bacterium]|nr:hypothetical protein [Vicinamibacterales bacterium]
MATKASILEQIGERSLLLPELINQGLAATDRLKYYLILLQTAYGYAGSPGGHAPDLRTEREAAGIADEGLDAVVGNSRMLSPTVVHIPGAAAILDRIFGDVRQMLEPVAAAAAMHGELTERSAIYARRLNEQIARAPTATDDQITSSVIETLTRVTSNGHDTINQIVMDLHWELNRLQAMVCVELLEGAHIYNLRDVDRQLVRAFMRGVHETAPLKFDHPGLETTATRDGDHLAIQNDLGVTDAHVLVIHVRDLKATIIYTDAYRTRARFIRELLEPHHIVWHETTNGHSFQMCTGSYEAKDQEALEHFLIFVGSRLVFLIDWNRARKRLSRFVRKSDAIELLKWAAANNVGHEAFLKTGDIKLIHTALARTTSTHVHYGARLDEILGRDGAKCFLMSVLQIASTGLSRRSSPRLIDDEIEAELLMYLQRSDRTLLGAMAEHAVVLAGMTERIHTVIGQLRAHQAPAETARTATLMRHWRSDADTILERARRTIDNVADGWHLRRLLSEGDRAVKVLDEAAFTLTLVPDGIDPSIAALLDALADLASRAAREYVRCLEDARDLSRSTGRAELERFLVAVDRLAMIESSCDEAERAVRERMFRGDATDFRQVYVVAELTRQLDRATDSLVHSGLLVRDYVLSVSPGG